MEHRRTLETLILKIQSHFEDRMDDIDIPKLEHGCNSWVVTNIKTGKAIETWDIELLRRLNKDEVLIETTWQYLARFNREIKE